MVTSMHAQEAGAEEWVNCIPLFIVLSIQKWPVGIRVTVTK